MQYACLSCKQKSAIYCNVAERLILLCNQPGHAKKIEQEVSIVGNYPTKIAVTENMRYESRVFIHDIMKVRYNAWRNNP